MTAQFANHVMRARRPGSCPATARGVTQRLHRQAPVMRKAGWSVSDDGGENKQHATRWQISPPSPEKGPYRASPSSPSSPTQDGTGRQARMASYASNDSDLSTGRTCEICGQPMTVYEAGQTAHPACETGTGR